MMTKQFVDFLSISFSLAATTSRVFIHKTKKLKVFRSSLSGSEYFLQVFRLFLGRVLDHHHLRLNKLNTELVQWRGAAGRSRVRFPDRVRLLLTTLTVAPIKWLKNNNHLAFSIQTANVF